MAAHLYVATFLFNTRMFNSCIESACRYHISAVVIGADIKFNTNIALSVSLFVAYLFKAGFSNGCCFDSSNNICFLESCFCICHHEFITVFYDKPKSSLLSCRYLIHLGLWGYYGGSQKAKSISWWFSSAEPHCVKHWSSWRWQSGKCLSFQNRYRRWGFPWRSLVDSALPL